MKIALKCVLIIDVCLIELYDLYLVRGHGYVDADSPIECAFNVIPIV